MTNIGSLLRILPFILPAQGDWIGSSLQRHGSLRKAYNQQGILTTIRDIPKALKTVKKAAEKTVKQTTQDRQKTVKKAAKMDPYQMVIDDVQMVFGYLMPGKRPNLIKKLPELMLVLLVVVWFAIYTVFIYENDRCPKLGRWAAAAKVSREDDPRIQLMKPDVVLVFHKPDFPYSDKDIKVSSRSLTQCLVGEKGHLIRSEALLQESILHPRCRSWTALTSSVSKLDWTANLSAQSSENEETEAAPMDDTEDHHVTVGGFRQALLQDICEHLSAEGFDVAVFSSVDNDELFVCIGLRNETKINEYLQRYGIKLQLRHKVIGHLAIKQPEEEVESSPPYIRYERRLAENVFGMKDLDIFRNWGANSGKPVVISGTDRIRIIHSHLNGLLNLDYAVEKELIVQWYPAHAEARIAELQQCWARWSLLKDLSVRQPVCLINDYFGSRVAFMFAWTGLYAKMLLCLLPVALLWWVLNSIVESYVGKNEFWHRGSVMGFSLVVAIWAKLASNLWKREEDFLEVLWNSRHAGKNKSNRADFSGTLEPDPTDGNKMSLQYPSWKYTLRMSASWLITLLFCALVFLCVVTWLNLFKGRMGIVASLVQAIMIFIFTCIYNWMAEALTLAENHKHQGEFYSSYLKKMFIFQLVNQYSAFFYMAVRQQFTSGGCQDDDCVGQINKALPVTLTILALMQILQVFVATLMVKFGLFLERRAMVNAGEDAPVYSFVEEQRKFGQFRIREQIEVMTQLSLTMGYVLIFGCIAPRIVPLCFIVFMMQLRSGGVLMTTAVNRTVPRLTVGIGAWNDVLYFLMLLGILFSAYLLVQFGPVFEGTLLITKLSGMFLYCFIIGVLWVCVDLVCPVKDPRSELLENRREVVEQRVQHIHEYKNNKGAKASTEATADGQQAGNEDAMFVQEVINAEWGEVPKLIPASPHSFTQTKILSQLG